MFEGYRWPRNPWSIFDELESLQADMNRAFSDWGGGQRTRQLRGGPVYPLMNVWSSDDGIAVDAELPGINPEDVEISVLGDELTLRVTTQKADEQNNQKYIRRERPAGEFQRTLRLPFRAESDAVKANYRNGVLRVSIPRAEEEKPKRIAIEAGS